MIKTKAETQFNFFEKLEQPVDFFKAISSYAEEVFHNNREKGFWDMCMKPLPDGELEFDPNLRNTGEMLMLMTSELAEGMEAHRKGLMDDHLPQYPGLWTELADTVIRILDYCGAHEVPIGDIINAKVEYNKSRPAKHGKKY